MSKKLTNAGLWIMLIALATANVLLIRQNLQMRRELEGSRPPTLKAGERLQPFTASGLDGEPISVSYTGNGPKRILLFFTPDCPYCREQFAYWREILQSSDRSRFEVLGLADESEDKAALEEYLRAMKCSQGSQFPLSVALIPKDVRRNYKLSATPVTVVVASDGTVEKAWTGRWTDTEVSEAEIMLGFNFKSP